MASNACDTGDVTVDARKLTDVQEACLFIVIGRAFVKGVNMPRAAYEAITARVTSEESPSIDVLNIGGGSMITICRNDNCSAPMYRTDVDDYNIVDIFLPAVEYDALIKCINV